MTAPTSVAASFTLKSYPLSVNIGGNGSGSVTSSPAGINCGGGTCSAFYNHGTTVTLTASPSAGSTFTGWSGGGCAGTGTCTVTMLAATAVTAGFTLNAYPLSVTLGGNGSGSVTSSPAGINCGGGTCSASYNQGTVVTLTASPSTGSSFAGWSGGGCAGVGTCTVTMTAATTVTAGFTLNLYVLQVDLGGTGTGTVTSSPAGIDCGTTCGIFYNHGTAVTLTATPMAGSTFTGWSGGGCTGTGTCTVTMTAATTVTANFAVAIYRLSVVVINPGASDGTNVVSSDGRIGCLDDSTGSCSAMYTQGSTVTLTLIPGPASAFARWTGVCAGRGPTCALTITADTSVAAIVSCVGGCP
jgi:hypothetical protein